MKEFIPVNEPLILQREKDLIQQCLDSGWISSEGPFVSQFENLFSKSVNRKYGISCSSGTAALEIAVKSLNIGPGDEVIVPTFTIISCVSAIIKAGATPVLVDADPLIKAVMPTLRQLFPSLIPPNAITMVNFFDLSYSEVLRKINRRRFF